MFVKQETFAARTRILIWRYYSICRISCVKLGIEGGRRKQKEWTGTQRRCERWEEGGQVRLLRLPDCLTTVRLV